MLSARALMETSAVLAEFERRVAHLLKEEDLGGLDALAQNGIFASRDPAWIKDNHLQRIDDRLEKPVGLRVHLDVAFERLDAGVLHREKLSADGERDFHRKHMAFLLRPAQTRPRAVRARFEALPAHSSHLSTERSVREKHALCCRAPALLHSNRKTSARLICQIHSPSNGTAWAV